ncbi:MAG: glycosyltransferase family 2 protein [Anaerolineales bacterium]|jgi:glycosyltransferase involved in cell wall biosynthesis|nr:glycosyltransferase family 2 protein [Anaerolineales bacterium]|tara:strand:- start:2881 stop:3819 length:939 start_codon:yes stop_codon:yes gene_type:complete
MGNDVRVAVVLPCYNEATTVGEVIDDFRSALPEANIYVFDNGSTDRSAEIAARKGCNVVKVRRRGKGHVVASIFRNVEADVYVLADSDGTYIAEDVKILLPPVLSNEADMVTGVRLRSGNENAFRPAHLWGNRLFSWLMGIVFGSRFVDILSGYRVFNSDVVRVLPIVAEGFGIEVQMTALLLYHGFDIREIELSNYHPRPAGSPSKLRTFRDGFLILLEALTILMAYKPLTFFGLVGIVLLVFGLGLGSIVITEFIKYQSVYRVPLAIVASAVALFGMGQIGLGITIHTIAYRLREVLFLMRRTGKNRDDI